MTSTRLSRRPVSTSKGYDLTGQVGEANGRKSEAWLRPKTSPSSAPTSRSWKRWTHEDLTQEELDIRTWRFSQLVEHGYELEDAMEIARAVHVDLEVARSLVAVHGCSSRLAVRILL